MTPIILPTGYHRIKIVNTFHELVSTPFSDGVNATWWQRPLYGNSREVVEQLGNWGAVCEH